MPSEENKILQQSFASIFKEHGYTKRRATWYHDTGGFICVFNIQGSQWGKQFYLNLGIYIKELGHKNFPNEYDCHIRTRVDNIIENNVQLFYP